MSTYVAQRKAAEQRYADRRPLSKELREGAQRAVVEKHARVAERHGRARRRWPARVRILEGLWHVVARA